jgi:hypothetical protein
MSVGVCKVDLHEFQQRQTKAEDSAEILSFGRCVRASLTDSGIIFPPLEQSRGGLKSKQNRSSSTKFPIEGR